MSFFRWLSWGLAVFSGLLVVLWTMLLLGPGWADAGGGYATPVIGATMVALIIGLAHRLAIGVHELELRRVASYIESLGRAPRGEGDEATASADHEACQAPPARFGAAELVDVVNQTFEPMCRRTTELARQRHEMDVRLRVTEAERRHLETILNTITDAVIVTDAFNELALANKAAARLLGFDLHGRRRQPIEQIVGDDALVNLIKGTRVGGHAALRRNVEHRLGHNGQACVYDVTLACVPAAALGRDHREPNRHRGRPRDGTTAAPASLVGEPATNGDAPAAGVVTILRDITREKEIQEMKSDFVSNVSHELRTPLSSIKAYMEMLIDGEAQDEQTRNEFYNIIQGETNRLSRLIDNILNINRIESGIVKVQRETVAMAPLVREAMDVMLPQARAKRITMTVVPLPLMHPVCADRDMILQAVLNYLSNAIKYTPEGGEVTIELAVDEHDRMVEVAVHDTGVGIPEPDVPHLFEKFYRVSDHKKLAKGTGLGLNMVKHVVETVHGGRVGVTSKPNEGSTFTLALPIAEEVQG